MNQDNNKASQEEELSDWEHCRRLFLEHDGEEAFFIAFALVRKGKAEALLDAFDRGQLTRVQLERYLSLADKLEDSLMRRAARLGAAVNATVAAWLAHKPNLSDEDRDDLSRDQRVVGIMAIVVALEKGMRGLVPPSKSPELREMHQAFGCNHYPWERHYDRSVEDWRENGVPEDEEDPREAKKRRRVGQWIG
ncbi:hypothetical protein LX32DRAFT_688910 [Colletotrichum zoysiae]|uniref:Uncharacterized protein n=1 Tax=Colletotrichum zoysiae TaxID=1216348 RepID=A0AAD9HVT7_9PEZI|nr:hypothetical protein LX32DRAFT_688910 [Colletotrichum zoysiae]